jgi:hypothetical protein
MLRINVAMMRFRVTSVILFTSKLLLFKTTFGRLIHRIISTDWWMPHSTEWPESFSATPHPSACPTTHEPPMCTCANALPESKRDEPTDCLAILQNRGAVGTVGFEGADHISPSGNFWTSSGGWNQHQRSF